MSQTENQSNSILDSLMLRRTIILSGEINVEMVDNLINRLLLLQTRSSQRIDLIIDSAGGASRSALKLCDVITSLVTAKVRGIALGKCGSAATFVMLHCHERISTPHSRFLIHSSTRHGVSLPVTNTTAEQLQNLLAEINSLEKKFLKLYTERLTPPEWDKNTSLEEKLSYIQNLIKRGDQKFNDWMSADEAVNCGLITKVHYENLGIFPT